MVAAAILTTSFLAQDALARDLLPVGSPAPAFEVKSVKGRNLAMNQNTEGKATVLVFWHLGSKASTEFLKDVGKVAGEFPAVRTWLIDHGDDPGSVKSFLEGQQIALPCGLSSPEGTDVAKLFGVRGYPTAYVVGKDGKVAWAAVKPNQPQLRQAVSLAAR